MNEDDENVVGAGTLRLFGQAKRHRSLSPRAAAALSAAAVDTDSSGAGASGGKGVAGGGNHEVRDPEFV